MKSLFKEKQELEKAKLKAKSEGDLGEAACCCRTLGSIYEEKEDYEAALSQYQEELEIVSNDLDCAIAHRSIGECLMNLERFEEAIPEVEAYRTLSEKIGNEYQLQLAYHVIGSLYFRWADVEHILQSPLIRRDYILKAYKAFETSLRLCQTSKDVSNMTVRKAAVHLQLGLVQMDLKEFKNAAEHFEAVIELQPTDTDAVRTAIAQLIDVHCKLGCFRTALKYALQLISKDQSKSNRNNILDSLVTCGHVYIDLEDFKNATTMFNKALKVKCSNGALKRSCKKWLREVAKLQELFDKCNATGQNTEEKYAVYEQMADTFADALSSGEYKHYTLAIKYYKEMLNSAIMLGKDPYLCYVSIARTYEDIEDYDKAVEYLKLVMEYEKESPSEQGQTLLSIAVLMEKRNSSFHLVNDAYNAASIVAEKSVDNSLLSNVYHDWFFYLKANKNAVDFDYEQFEQVAKRWDGLEAFYNDQVDNPSKMEVGDDSADNCEMTSSENESPSSYELERSQSQKRRKKQFGKPKTNLLGETDLHVACIKNKLNTVLHYFKDITCVNKKGHPVNVFDNAGWTPLHEAANRGFTSVIQILIENGADLNIRGCQQLTAAMDAAVNGHLDAVLLLLNHGADVNLLDEQGLSLLYYLCDWEKDNKDELQSDCEIQATFNRVKSKVLEMMDADLAKEQLKIRNPLKRKRHLNDQTNEDISNEAKFIKDKKCVLFGVDEEEEINFDQPGGGKKAYLSALKSLGSRAKRVKVTSIDQEQATTSSAAYAGLVTEDEFKIAETFFVDDNDQPIKMQESRKQCFSTTDRRLKNNNSRTSAMNRKFHKESACEIDRQRSDADASQTSSAWDVKKVNENNTRKTEESSSCWKFDEGLTELYSEDGQSSVEESDDNELQETESTLCQSVIYLKINVDGWNCAVPISKEDHSKDVKWLTEEIATRYAIRHYHKPILILCTEDGAELCETDSIQVVISAKLKLQCRIVDWNEVPTAATYKQLCESVNMPVCETILEALRLADESGKLVCDNFSLDDETAPYVFESILFSKLSVLDMSCNTLSKECMIELGNVLICMSNLISLSLSCCSLTSDHLSFLAQTLQEHSLQNLHHLDLSFNILGDGCTVSLMQLLCQCPKLRSLDLRGVGLTNNFQILPQHNWPKFALDSLNLQYNAIDEPVINFFLTVFTPMKKLQLCCELNNTQRSVESCFPILSNFELMTDLQLTNVNLGFCFRQFVEMLPKLKSLCSLDVSLNKLSVENFTTLLDVMVKHCPVLVSVDFDGNEPNAFEQEPFRIALKLALFQKQKSIQFLRLTCKLHLESTDYEEMIEMWRQRWNKRSVVQQLHSQLTLTIF
ncbi:Tonsoku-like protein [Trichinella pseudospiralis]|uniref:Tonsoku-like protein n=1 Tax=Trichinella pseudospiralis TaxID=6337 RepID=A0A0V1K0S6_TRIPS|nr:Tonsoku-like protein [Trichinella pseudospiralis]KRZ23375.1 Tonsoku-like protein [Trichinella pseudospiralis]KRZ40797.1 Tonsoku-like protein [Trichinella pseudospiralis]